MDAQSSLCIPMDVDFPPLNHYEVSSFSFVYLQTFNVQKFNEYTVLE